MILQNNIYNENHLITMSNMPPECIDLVITSPPYDDLRDYEGYDFDFNACAEALFRVIKPGGVLVWVVGDQCRDGGETLTSFKQAIRFQEIGFRMHDTMIYEKNGALPDNVRYFQVFEYMFILSKGRPKTIHLLEDRKNRFQTRWGKGRTVREKDGSLTSRSNFIGREYGRRTNIWKYATGAGYSSKDEISFQHPATFPEQLAADHIASWSDPGDLVYDPMGGSGTVAKMAHLAGRNWIISEMSTKYCEIAKKRISPYINQGIITEFLNPPHDFADDDLPDDDFLEGEEIEFNPCDNCDLPDACADFGCAIKAGIKEDPSWK